MKLHVNIDKTFKEAKIIIESPILDEEIQQIISFIQEKEPSFIVGRINNMQHILKPDEIHYFHTENEQVLAVTQTATYVLREKLYELEALLPSHKFIRLSKSAIANLYELSHFEASFSGTLCVYFKSGKKEYVSRSYVPAIKKALNVNRRKTK